MGKTRKMGHMTHAVVALSKRQLSWLLGGLMLAMLLAALDQTIVGTALPTIVGDLGGLDHYSWVVTAYLLASTASTPLYGKISDLYGRRPVLLFTIVSDVVAPRDRPRYQGLFGAVFGISSVAGPLVGGYFAENDWRWIFYINVPLAIAAIFICYSVLRLVPHTKRNHRVDWLGAGLLVLAVVCVLLALSFGGT